MNLNKSRSPSKDIVHGDKEYILSGGKKGAQWIYTVPIKFHLRDLVDGFAGRSLGSIRLHELENTFGDKPELIENNPDKEEIMAALASGLKVHGQSFQYEKHKPTLIHASETKRRLNMAISTKDPMNWKSDPEYSTFTLIGDPDDHNEPVFLLGFVKYRPADHRDKDTPLAKVVPKCNFGIFDMEHEDGSVTEDVNGGQMITFPYESSVDPEVFKQNMVEAINRTKVDHPTYIPHCTPSIRSMYDAREKSYKGVFFDRDIFTQQGIDEMVMEVERECQVTLRLSKSVGCQPKRYFKYASISW